MEKIEEINLREIHKKIDKIFNKQPKITQLGAYSIKVQSDEMDIFKIYEISDILKASYLGYQEECGLVAFELIDLKYEILLKYMSGEEK